MTGALLSCVRPAAPLVLSAVEPNQVGIGEPIAVTLRGEGFAPRVRADFDAPDRSEVDARFSARLVGEHGEVALEQVVLHSAAELSAVVPRGLALGTYDLELTDPLGRTASLAGALRVEVAECPAASGAHCVISGSCVKAGEASPFEPCLVCDPAQNPLGWTARPEGASCGNGNRCTEGEVCRSATCTGLPLCGNTPPRPCLEASPAAGLLGNSVGLDARCSRDAENAPGALQARFDFEGDGVFDTVFGPLVASHVYPSEGTFLATVEVRDPGGLSGFAQRRVSIATPAADLEVTTAQDEADPGATAELPGGSGLSLREAILLANATGAPRRIRFSGPMILVLARLPQLTANGSSIVGGAGVVLDFRAQDPSSPDACLTLAGADQALIRLELQGCPGPVLLDRGVRNRISECRFSPGARTGLGVRLSGADGVFGPGNEVEAFAAGCLEVRGTGIRVEGNRLHGCGTGVEVENNADSAALRLNLVYANRGDGAWVGRAGSVQLWNNTVAGNGGDGIELALNALPVDVRNNALTGNGEYGVRGLAQTFAGVDPNLFFSNGSGAWSGGAPGSGSVLADPLFLAEPAGDFGLAPGSPAINAGADLGLDVNGPALGNFHGSQPDLGAQESPY